MIALLSQSNSITFEFKRKRNELGNPPPGELNQYPDLEQAYNTMQAIYRRIDETGYQEMPPEVYLAWLKSMQREEQLQQDKAEYEKLLKELNRLKNIKPSLKNKPKQ